MPLTEEDLMHVPGLLSRWALLPGGVRAHYVTAGETGPAVVLLHGGIAGSSGLAGWRSVAGFLGANGFRVYCPDLPGFGLTVDAADFYRAGPVGHRDFVHDFADALVLDRFHLGGNSMGCAVAAYFLVTHPHRVTSFALVAGSVGDLVADPPVPTANGRARTRRFDGTAASMREMLTSIVLDPATISDDLVEMRTRHALRNEAAYRRHQQAPRDATTAVALATKGRLDRLGIPGIYVYGRQDRLISAEDRGYAQEDALPGVQFFYPDRCGHQAQTDRPDVVGPLLLELFRDGVVSGPTAESAGVSDRRPVNPDLVAAAKEHP
ncbi:alpha/beta hydrolase [Solwaraspora sp. WMMD1047]|uniref:alpha/beta fold hydrolase n=1 Tax=Solwaraspora sp. WMMD1047 TaxID=3016102 RepID=UPI002416542A|nr:alpha/beta hydrolase [Solwaraspora sp. WMMD1047]MDG4834297.1 alpha/beta hydrolase [Solwaraspora sp. WMMD1047]